MWYEDIKDKGFAKFLDEFFIEKGASFIPKECMSLDEKLDASIRFSLYLFGLTVIMKKRLDYIWIPVVVIIGTLIIKEELMEKSEGFYDYKGRRENIITEAGSNNLVDQLLKDQYKEIKKPIPFSSMEISRKLGKPGDSIRNYKIYQERLNKQADSNVMYKTREEKYGEYVRSAQETKIKLGLGNTVGDQSNGNTTFGFGEADTNGVTRWAAPQLESMYEHYEGRRLKPFFKGYA
jgi:hypothetical protein